MQAYLAQRWELASASNIKLSVNLRELNSEQLHTLCTPMYIFDGPVSHISSYTQYLGWIETGTGDIPGQYSTVTPLCREALVLYRVGVAPQWLQEGNLKRNSTCNNRFQIDRICDFCFHAFCIKCIHDAFHVMFECPLLEKERHELCSRIPPSMIREYYGFLSTLYQLHVTLLCPRTVKIAAAVGHFLACSIAKMGVFRVLHEALHLADLTEHVSSHQCHQLARQYKGKWLSIYRSKLSTMYDEVIYMFALVNRPYMAQPIRTLTVDNWACECVMDVDYSLPLHVILPSNWRDILQQSKSISNYVHSQLTRVHIQPTAKAQAKALIGKFTYKPKYNINHVAADSNN